MKKTTIQVILYSALISILLGACSAASAPKPAAPQPLTKIKVSVLPFLSYGPVFIAKEEGFYAEQGFDVEFVRIDKTSEAIPALAQGQIDVASGNIEVSTLNAVAKGGIIKYVSDKGYLDPNACSSSTFVSPQRASGQRYAQRPEEYQRHESGPDPGQPT